MGEPWNGGHDDVEQLLLNARLRDALEPFSDESLQLISARRVPTHIENEFLASMLAWERAPTLPIAQWFEPELVLPHPSTLDDEQLSVELARVVERLFEKRIVLEYTSHLSDRALYCLIYRDILPSYEKKIELPGNYLYWHCLDHEQDPLTWLRYYATDEERRRWQAMTGRPLPPVEPPPFPRRLPRPKRSR